MQRRPNRDRKLAKARGREVETSKRPDALKGRRKAEEQPRYAAQLRAFLNLVPAHIWYATASGGLTFVNKRTADYLGLPEDHPLRLGVDIGAKWDVHIPLLHPDDQEETRKAWSTCLRTGEAGEASFRVRNAVGGYRWFLSRAEPLRASNGAILQWVGVNLDIEELKCAERALRESEAIFRDYAQSASDWYWETDPDHKFTRVTDYERLLAGGFVPASRIGLARWEFATDVESEPEKWELHRSVLEARQPFRDFVYRSTRGNGSLVYYKISGKPIYDTIGAFVGYRGTGTDVTAAMRAQKEHEKLHQLESDLARMNRVSMMGELAASLSHELTQPIASARNNACAAENFLNMQPLDLGEARQAVRCVVDDTDRAGDMIDRIRDHIKKTPPRKDRFDLNKAIDEVIVLGRSAIIKHGVSVQTRLSEGLLPIHGDRVQLQQVVLNLILNGVEAMDSSNVGARELLISTEQEHNGILVAVRDSGQGIDPPYLERVFDAFYTTKSSGMGMGLPICRSIVEAHGGRLWAEANEPRGTVFKFTLPAVDHEFSSGVHSPDVKS